MIPNTDEALTRLTQHLLADVVPALSTEYAMADAATLGQMLMAVSEELKEGIYRRLCDISEMQAILGECDLSTDEQNLVSSQPDDMKLATVNAHHDALTRLIIKWHALSEQAADLTQLNDAIWQYLGRTTERHAITLDIQ